MEEDLFTMLFGQPNITPAEQERKRKALAMSQALRVEQGTSQPEPPPQPVPPPQAPPQPPPQPVPPQAPVQAPGRPPGPPQPPGGQGGGLGLSGSFGGPPGGPPVTPPPQAGAPAQVGPDGRPTLGGLYGKLNAAMAEPDRTAMEEAYQKQASRAPQHLALALAAKEAGEDFAPFAAQHLKQSAEARAPMKMGGGTMTETGFIEDPDHAREFKIKQIDAQIKQLETVAENAAKAEDRDLARQQVAQLARERNAMMGMIASVNAGARADAAAGRRTDAEIRNSGALSKQFDSVTKNYVEELDATRKLGTLAPGRRPNAIEQQSMMVLINKFLDPGSVVREGEFDRIALAQGLVGRAENWARRVGSGEPLSDDLVRDIRQMGQLYEKAATGKIQAYGDLYSQKAQRFGLNPEDVVVNPYYKHAVQQGQQQPGAAPAAPASGPPTATGPNGQKIKLVNGQWVPA
jgi:hypothetical protein